MEQKDPLAQRDLPPDRLYYAPGVLLNADDLADEQAYHRGRLARALAYLHGAGTAAGLRVDYAPHIEPGDDPAFPHGRAEELTVQPGVAVDRLGRLVELLAPACIDLQQWYADQDGDDLLNALHPRQPPRTPVTDDPFTGIVADIFINFVSCERGRTPAFAHGNFDALNATVPARLRDYFRITLVLRQEDAPPLPPPSWPRRSDNDDPAEPLRLLHERILDAWQGGLEFWQNDAPRAPAFLPPGIDPTALFLARLALPVRDDTPEGDRPVRGTGAPIIDNRSRGFVYPPVALVRWLELDRVEE
jgi:hypothetical protein